MKKMFPKYKNLISSMVKRHIIPFRRKLSNNYQKIEYEKNKNNYRWGIFILTAGIASYCFYKSDYYNMSNMSIANINKKLMSIDRNHSCVIVFVQDQKFVGQQSNEIKLIQKKEITKKIVRVDRKQKKQLQSKFGKSITVLSPTSIDQLCIIIERCNNYKYSILLGNYPLQQSKNTQEINYILQQLKLPNNKQKYIVVNLSQLKNISIDHINDVVAVESGIVCREFNKMLDQNGFVPFFQDFYGNISLYDAISSNLPLINNEDLISKLHNLTLISIIDGRKFKSSTQVESYGKTPNLTSLFVGSGGALAIPIIALFKVKRKLCPSYKKQYLIESNNPSQIAEKWREIVHEISQKSDKCILKRVDNKLIIETNKQKNLCSQKGLIEYKKQNMNGDGSSDYIFIVNNQMVENLLINSTIQFEFSIQNSLLSIKNSSLEDIQKLIGIINAEGGMLIWSRDKNGYNRIKGKNNINQAQTMKIIDAISEKIDQNNVMNFKEGKKKYKQKESKLDNAYYI